MRKEKRYVVTMDVYVYAENDYMARKKAWKIAADSMETYGSEPNVIELVEQPFGSFENRAVEDISKPRDKNEKLPF